MAIQNNKKGTLGQTIQITVASTTDQTQKVRVEVPSGTSVMDAVRKAGIADGQVDVFDSMGQVVTRDRADTLSNQTVYVGPKRVAGGMDLTPGLKDEELKRMQIHYPSTRAVRSHRLAGGQVGAVVLNVPGVRSHRSSEVVQYQILLDLREFPSKTPRAYVLSPESSEIEHCNVFRGERYEVAGPKTICAICLGNIDEVFTSFRKERRTRLNMFLNHLQNVMNSPNPSDTARSV